MKPDTMKKLYLAIAPVAISAFLFWIGFEAFEGGAPRAKWLPHMTFALLYPWAYYVPRLGVWARSDRPESREFDSWDWATLAVFASWPIAGLVFMAAGYLTFVVVASTVLGTLGAIAVIADRLLGVRVNVPMG